MINVLDPDVIVLGGGMSNVPRLADEVAALLPRYVFSDDVVTRVRKLAKEANAVIGARYDATEIMQGVTEVLSYGTAVEVEPIP